ncbi:MAG TPA: hypothetical protein VGM11_10170 [Acidobacteriaceae bacterium]
MAVAAPSHPLAVSIDPNTWHTPGWKFNFAEGTYKVEPIDIWLMNIYRAGYTSGGSQQFRSSIIMLGIIHLTRVENTPPNEKLLPVAELLQRFAFILVRP